MRGMPKSIWIGITPAAFDNKRINVYADKPNPNGESGVAFEGNWMGFVDVVGSSTTLEVGTVLELKIPEVETDVSLEKQVDDCLHGTTTVVWHKYPEDPPPALTPGQYERHLVALKSGHVLECSWLFGKWCESHDGCSDRTNQVRYWCEKPKAPQMESTDESQ